MEQNTNSELQILIEKARNGNQDAFKKVFNLTSNRLFAYALSHTSNREDSQDIVQDTFISIWNSLTKFKYKSDEQYYGFIFVILKRKLYKHHKTKRMLLRLDENYTKSSYQLKVNNGKHLFKEMGLLAKNSQEILKLRYVSQMSFSEIANELDIKETTAKTRHHRAIKKLKILLIKNNYEKNI